MFRGGFVFRFLFVLLVAVALTAGAFGLYRLGFAQGYQASALAATPAPGQNPGSGQIAPPAPYYGYGPWMYGPRFYGPGFGFFPFFPLFGLFFFVIIFLLVSSFFRFMLFRRWAGGPGRWRDEDMREWRERHGGSEEKKEEDAGK